jgi:tetrahydromethanopterin S-methyltransferase subunit G
MTIDVTREEFEARVGVLEREVEGEKMVTRYILEQSRRNGDDLAAVKSRLDRVEARLDRVESRLDRVEQKVDALGSELSGLRGAFAELRRELPKIVAETVREVFRERDGRS